MRQLIVDPEFQKQIPPLTSEELDQLEKNILQEGQVLDPIIVWNDIILDGHNRYQIVQGHPEIKFDVKSLEFEDRNQAQIWICLHQLGRRNLTHEQKKYLMGMRYEIEKASHGASNGFRGNSHTKDLVSYQNGNLLKTERTCDRIAKELNVGRSTVIRANEFAKGLTAAEEVSPGILQGVLSGSVKAAQDEVSALARASPDTRKELVEKIRHPPTKEKRLLKNLLLHPHSQTQSRLNYLLSKSVQMHWQDLSHPMGTVSFLGPLHTCRRGRGRILGRVRYPKKSG